MRQSARTMSRRFLLFLVSTFLFVPAILWLDGASLARQLALGAATAVFVAAFAKAMDVDPRQVVAAIVVASLGECVLSLGWGLYTYRDAVIPLYVPPGHGLFYMLAAVTARQQLVRDGETWIVRGVLAGGSVVAVASLVAFGDTWGLLWWVAAALLIARSRNRLLLSVCFVYTMLLEWSGTAMGNWRWAAEVPYVGLMSANPPSGVGILYVVLDLIVVACATIAASVWHRRGAWRTTTG